MGIRRTQSCEMCGRERALDVDEDTNSKGWRELSSGGKAVTLCVGCVGVVVDHALTRLSARLGGHPGDWNDRPLLLQFWEAPK